MSQNSGIVGELNDLILINNDRIEGYKKAYDETNAADNDLRSLFSNLSEDSRRNIAELTEMVNSLGGEPATGTMLSGKIYRAWMDLKAAFSSDDRKTALENAAFGEEAAQKAYDAALTSDDLTPDLRSLVIKQKAILKTGHDSVKRLRDMEKVLN